jgi:hypothetical protein
MSKARQAAPNDALGCIIATGQRANLPLQSAQEMNTLVTRLLVASMISMLLAAASFAAVAPTPPYPGASPSLAYKVTVDGQPVFTYRFPTYSQFNWMD